MNTITFQSAKTCTRLNHWLQRTKQRLHTFGAYVVHQRQLRILIEHDDHLLRDIGVTRFDLERQMRQGFRNFRDENFT